MGPGGRIVSDGEGAPAALIRRNFLFCLESSCRLAYVRSQRSERFKLATLGVDNRSTATTILRESEKPLSGLWNPWSLIDFSKPETLHTGRDGIFQRFLSVRALIEAQGDRGLSPEARKLLSFTDNRQDTSLQAGHFNDFAQVALLRSALHRASERSQQVGLCHGDLSRAVFDAMNPRFDDNADALRWLPGNGEDRPIDRTRLLAEGGLPAEVNRYFVECYRRFVDLNCVLEAREHTAQVTSQDRQEHEARFREGDLPLLFCSPTMELGVDIAQLGLVNLRNVPPTPANYAQCSGRAGRGEQPALAFIYPDYHSS